MVSKPTNGRGTPPVCWLLLHVSGKTSRTNATATFFVFLTLLHPFCIFAFFAAEKLQPLYIEMAPKRIPQALQQPSNNFPRITLKHPRSPREHPRAPREPPGSPQGPPRSTSELPTTFQEPPGSAQELPSNHQTTKQVVLCAVVSCFMCLFYVLCL